MEISPTPTPPFRATDCEEQNLIIQKVDDRLDGDVSFDRVTVAGKQWTYHVRIRDNKHVIVYDNQVVLTEDDAWNAALKRSAIPQIHRETHEFLDALSFHPDCGAHPIRNAS